MVTDKLKQTWTREELRRALMDYDAFKGQFPEDVYQGLDVWLWLNGVSEDPFTAKSPDDIKAEAEKAWKDAPK